MEETMKIIKVKQAEKFALEFSDGKRIEMCFNMKALQYLAEEINGKKILTKSHEFFAAIIYSGCKACNENFTIAEADALYATLEQSTPEALEAVIIEYYEASGVDEKEIKKNAILNILRN